MSDRAARTLPAWALAFDAIGVGFILIAASVLVTGGYRGLTPIGRVSVTSWLRPLAAAVALVVIRHWREPQPSLARRVAVSVTAWWPSDAARVVWPVFVSTRIGVILIGFLGIAMLGYAPNTPPWRSYDNDFYNLPARWDTGWYLGIAERGYRWDPALAHRMQNIAFFPAYPMLIRAATPFLGRQPMAAAMIVSFAAFFFALCYLFRLARSAIGDDRAATAVALLAAYPFAVFYSTAYTESLFLLTAVGACYHFERDELWRASAWGILAGLARPNGCLLSIVLALMAWHAEAPSAPAAAERQARRRLARLVAAAAPGIGLLIFSAYIYSLTGHPLEWARNHAAFGRVYRSLDLLVDDRIKYINANGFYNYVTVLVHDWVNVVPSIFGLAIAWPIYRRFGAPYGAMVLVNVLLPLLMGGVLSMGRVTSVIFPIFLWLAVVIPPRQRSAWLMAFAMTQALFAVAFFTWRPLY